MINEHVCRFLFLKSHFISFKGGIFSCDTDNCNNGLIPTNCTQSDYKPFGGNPFGNKTDIDANLYTTTKNPMNVTSEMPGGGNSIVMTKSLSGLILIINLMIAYFFYYWVWKIQIPATVGTRSTHERLFLLNLHFELINFFQAIG